jgi:predicted PurR-regulated permease PerM
LALLSIPRRPPKFLDFGTGLIALTASVALLYYGRDFFVTLIISAVFAFILDPAVLLVMKLRVPRGAATPIVIGIAFAAMYLIGLLIWTQVTTLTEDFPTYTSRLSELVDKANGRLDEIEQHTIENIVPKSLRQQQQQIQQKPQEAMKARRRRAGLPLPAQPVAQPQIQEVRIRPDPKPVITTLYGYLSQYLHVIVMASFIPFLVYFMLSWRDRIGDSTLRLFDGEKRYIVERSWIGIADSTRAYVLGNFLLWVFVSSASAIVFFFLEVPYWAIAGPVSGFFSLVPYVGLPLSIIPPVIASVAVPAKFKVVLTVILFTAALHVLSMNFLYAKIIGRRVRLNPLVVTIALLFWGAVWGGIGLILAIPITAGLKAVCDNVDSLKGYGELLGD